MRTLRVIALLLLCGAVLSPAAAAAATTRPAGSAWPAAPADPTAPGAVEESPDEHWRWPVPGPRRVVEPFRAPAHAYGPGHRGIDVAAPTGTVVHAPADGTVAFRGIVVDRPLITIEHPGGFVTTFEPLASELAPGTPVSAGQPVGIVAAGGHTPPGALHLGVRLHGVYLNPMLLFGEVPRAVLLPCCRDG